MTGLHGLTMQPLRMSAPTALDARQRR